MSGDMATITLYRFNHYESPLGPKKLPNISEAAMMFADS
jgi:hypothetical protein